jgi:hypothetical protein
MSRGVDRAKVALWRERLARSRTSDLSIAAFCQGEGVTTASYYAWRRKLGVARARPAKPKQRAFQQLVVSGLAPALTARLPGGVELEIPSGQEAALRTVVSELVRVGRLAEVESGSC